MSILNSIRLAVKVPVFMVVFSVCITTVMSTISIVNARTDAIEGAKGSLRDLALDRGSALSQWIDSIEADVLVQAALPSTAAAIDAFTSSWRDLGEGQKAALQTAYIAENENKAGEKQLMNRAPGSERYHAEHANFHPAMRTMAQARGYSDVFFVSPEGNIVYSVFKEADFATNVVSGEFAESGIGDVVRQALDGAPGQVYFSDFAPYAPNSGAPGGFLAVQAADMFNRVAGVFVVQVPIDQLDEVLNAPQGLGETGEAILLGPDLRIRNDPRIEGRFDFLQKMETSPAISAALNGTEAFLQAAHNFAGAEVLGGVAPLEFLGLDFALLVQQESAEVMAPVNRSSMQFVAISVVAAIVLCVLGWLFGRSITNPILEFRNAMARVSDGELDTEVTVAERGDEIGDIGKVLVGFQAALQAAQEADIKRAELQAEQEYVVEELSHGLVRMSKGDFSRSLDESFGPTYDKLREDFNKTLSTLNGIINEVALTAENVNRGALEIAQGSDNLSNRTENQAATLEETAAALDEMTASVRSAAEGARSVAETVDSTRKEAENSGEVVRKAVTAMGEIEKSSSHISQIIGVIEDIAFQTNLLALNAGVEAARAGDAGKGFAVVASEVRALAQRSSEAAREIKSLIGSSTSQVAEGANLVGQAGEALVSIVGSVSNISDLIADIATGAREQSTGLDEINVGVTELDRVTQENAAMVDQSSAASHMLKSDATRLVELVSHFATSKAEAAHDKPQFERPSAHGATQEVEVHALELPLSAASNENKAASGAATWKDF